MNSYKVVLVWPSEHPITVKAATFGVDDRLLLTFWSDKDQPVFAIPLSNVVYVKLLDLVPAAT